MEYIIKVSNNGNNLIDVRGNFSDLLEYAKNHIQAGYTIIDCYQMEGISRLQESLQSDKIPRVVVLPQYESRNADLLYKVMNSSGASSIKEQVIKAINMENQVQTIVCPNCGASATNRHNCEYCGSFLVQRAAEGVDVTDYVEMASNYKNEGLAKAIKTYGEIIKEHNLAFPIWFAIKDEAGKTIKGTLLAPNSKEKPTGFAITLIPAFLHEQYDRFKDSSLYKVFKDEGIKSTLDFGYDSEGASKVLTQLLAVFGEKKDGVSYYIYDAEARDNDNIDTDLLVFNKNGEIIKDNANYQNQGYIGISERHQQNVAMDKKKGCAGMLAFLLASGVGSTFGIVELIKSIFG